MVLPGAEAARRVRNDYPITSKWVIGHILWIALAVLFYLVYTGHLG